MKIRDEEELLGMIVAVRRHLHRRPELSMREYETAAFVEAELDRLGLRHQRVGETGVLAWVEGRPGKRCVVLRADMDALPIREQSDREYRSETDGVMHACGHDGHVACLLGAARILSENREAFTGTARLIFQPGEEIGRGTRAFIDGGCLEGAERVFGLHTAPELPSGTVGIKPGLNNAGVDLFKIRVQGKSAHVSTPHLGVDALYIASHIVVALQALATRRSSPVEPLILGVGKLHAGTTYNALADSAELEGTTRTVSQETRERMRREIERLCGSIAGCYGGTVSVEWDGICPPLINEAAACAEAARAASRVEGLKVWDGRPLSLSGDNFADFQLLLPGAYAYLGTGNPAVPNSRNAGHSVNFDLDEDALLLGAKLYAAFVEEILG